jgi:uncharacterized protein GlcG (DUF336 family)
MGIGGRAMAKRASDSPVLGCSQHHLRGRIVPVAGGVLILQAGRVIGGVGMSGDLPDNDEACTVAGIQKADRNEK